MPQAMAQFVLKIEKLSHIMGPTPILEMARAYGLRPRLWLLVNYIYVICLGRSVLGKTVPEDRGHSFLNTDRPRPANNVFIIFFPRVLCKQFLC